MRQLPASCAPARPGYGSLMRTLQLLPILIPACAGAALGLLRLQEKQLRLYVLLSCAGTVLVAALLLVLRPGALALLRFSTLSLLLYADSLSLLFLLLASILWLVVAVYSFPYFHGGEKLARFYSFYLLSLGLIMGVCLSGNLLTLYVFYELMTLAVYPLVIHEETPDAMLAGRKYLAYSFLGAALILIGLLFSSRFGGDFMPGGVLTPGIIAESGGLLQAVFFTTFLGFGCKTGLWPLHEWLPVAHPNAPSPASALLSGVVTKTGVLGLLRITFYQYGADFLRGSWAQAVLLGLILFTIFLGSMRAYREPVLKKRLAYSTVSQVSYILFGIMSLSATGLLGALLHVVSHAIIKCLLFLFAGAVIHQTGKIHVQELYGLGRWMPFTFGCCAVAALALTGIPPTAGFISKWYLALGGLESTLPWVGIAGAATLILSALLTAGYLFPIALRSFFPPAGAPEAARACEPDDAMVWPMLALAAVAVLLGIFPHGLMDGIQAILAPLY